MVWTTTIGFTTSPAGCHVSGYLGHNMHTSVSAPQHRAHTRTDHYSVAHTLIGRAGGEDLRWVLAPHLAGQPKKNELAHPTSPVWRSTSV